ncbi:hypothetical protein [Brumicola nitratireducens]|uniref:Uncharacterized protein n=1 Tax=Glaciecola nitratireducens (strain JCM 12485 / KCTC 12276 / FR1064) TaxID=1085623 RepID=G4QKQ3_GLANF|nr:hypothetical protein [Glaciecola nitratireducens]AEP30356.1 hypothetical protein GNIT_2255 [Glaciecola nitratireducens FR1064]
MLNKIAVYCIGTLALIFSAAGYTITPTFNIVQTIKFGTVLPATGSCLMHPETAELFAFQGEFICAISESAQNGIYTIIANPNKDIEIKVTPSLDDGAGIMFNPRVQLESDTERKYILNNNNFVIIDSGDSGIVNLFLGGELSISEIFAFDQTISFNFVDAIEWNEIN